MNVAYITAGFGSRPSRYDDKTVFYAISACRSRGSRWNVSSIVRSKSNDVPRNNVSQEDVYVWDSWRSEDDVTV